MSATWMVRAGRAGRFYDTFRENGFVAMGWSRVGPAPKAGDRSAFVTAVRQAYPESSPQSALVTASQLLRFTREIAIGDRVVTYDSGARIYSCGTISGEYEYHPDQEEEELTNRRSVRWLHEKSRDELSVSARNSLGSTLTLFRIEKAISEELWATSPSKEQQTTEPTIGSQAAIAESSLPLASATFEQLQTAASEGIKDKIAALDAYEMQDLVAGILRSMGYQTTVAPKGADRSSDIRATPDGFGFKDPRIVVEVKHRPGQRMGAPDIRTFMGGRKSHERCMFVSTGGFAREAYYEAERSTIPLTLIDMDQLVAAVLRHYPTFDEATRRLLPLELIYWPL